MIFGMQLCKWILIKLLNYLLCYMSHTSLDDVVLTSMKLHRARVTWHCHTATERLHRVRVMWHCHTATERLHRARVMWHCHTATERLHRVRVMWHCRTATERLHRVRVMWHCHTATERLHRAHVMWHCHTATERLHRARVMWHCHTATERNVRVQPPETWSHNLRDLNLVDHSIWGILQEGQRSQIHDVKELKECLLREWRLLDHSVIVA